MFKQLPMFQRVGSKAFKKDLKNIKALDRYLKHPHRSYDTIHIAGTNGKGSTSFFLASILSELGYKVGLYTSPHYKDYRERIKVNGQMISKSYVKSFVNKLIEDNILSGDLRPSFFEITVAMAFSYFRQEKVDIAVIETGLGGRLDSTNIIQPKISVITNIGMDHTNFLGNTLRSIAKEKAGIIKKNTPVVIGRRQKETHPVFSQKANKMNANMTYANKSSRLLTEAILSNFPDYQKENILTALSTIKKLAIRPTETQIKNALTEGLRDWGFLGRYMNISDHPKIIFDSAHNIDGIRTLMHQIGKEWYDDLHIVIAMVGDKDQSPIIKLLPRDANYYVSQAKIPRAMHRDKLAQLLLTNGLSVTSYTTVPRAFAAAKRKASASDLVLVAGSIFTVAELV